MTYLQEEKMEEMKFSKLYSFFMRPIVYTMPSDQKEKVKQEIARRFSKIFDGIIPDISVTYGEGKIVFRSEFRESVPETYEVCNLKVAITHAYPLLGEFIKSHVKLTCEELLLAYEKLGYIDIYAKL